MSTRSVRGKLNKWHSWIVAPSDLTTFARAAVEEARAQPIAVYFNVHRPRPALPYVFGKLRIEDVDAFQFIYVDADAVTEKTCATEAAAAHALTQKIARDLQGFAEAEGFELPQPLLVDTGNGGSLDIPVDLSNTEEHRQLQKDFIAELSPLYSTAAVSIDRSIAEPSRVTGVVGTLNAKKTAVPEEGRTPRRRRVLAPLPSRDPCARTRPSASCPLTSRQHARHENPLHVRQRQRRHE
jgi:hypothetical protein